MSDVHVYIYDLSMGMAKSLSVPLIGTRIEGIWHTGVVVYGREIFYGSQGISQCKPCGTPLKEPLRKQFVGRTMISSEDLDSYLKTLSKTLFRGGHYRLFDHNCNTFSEHLVNYLTNQHIPDYVLNLPHIISSTPLGGLIKPALNTLSAGLNVDPMFGVNQHSFEEIQRSFKPILYVEPLSSELSPSRIAVLWPTSSATSHQVKKLVAAVARDSADLLCDVEQYRLLEVNQLETCDQAHAILELFRLAVWQEPSVLIGMLTDPNHCLQRLPLSPLPGDQGTRGAAAGGGIPPLDTEMARCKLMCNCVGLSSEWKIGSGENIVGVEDSEPVLQMEPVVHIALMLLGHSEHLWRPGDKAVIDPSHLVPHHRQAGLGLAHNLALHPQLKEACATELGIYLIHLAVEKDKCYSQPTEAITLLRTIYFLVIRFQCLADYARTCDLQACLSFVLNEVTSPSSCTADTDCSSGGTPAKPGAPVAESGVAPEGEAENPDYELVSYLIDFLNSP